MIKLSNRLSAVASLVSSGALVADIGCDHGYLSVSLVQNGAPHIVACDINEGPLDSCRALVSQMGLCDKISVRLSDGLQKVKECECDDIVIAGMGGELIGAILSKCSFAVHKHLVLQPMTHPELLRKWLFDNGYKILNDIVVPDGDHHYSVFDAVYSGETPHYTDVDLYLGRINDYSDKEYFNHLIHFLENKQKGGCDFTALIDEIKDRIK